MKFEIGDIVKYKEEHQDVYSGLFKIVKVISKDSKIDLYVGLALPTRYNAAPVSINVDETWVLGKNEIELVEPVKKYNIEDML